MTRTSFVVLCLASLMAVPALANPDSADTPLPYMARFGSVDDVRRLLDAGADVDVRDSDGDTPLHGAAILSRFEVVALLLEAGAEVNARRSDGITPLHYAVSSSGGDPELIALLLEADADVNARGSAFHIDFGSAGFTPLHAAVMWSGPEVVALLLQAGADVNARRSDGITPLHSAEKRRNPEVVTLLLEAGADVNARDSEGEILLHKFGLASVPELVALLLEAGADVNARDSGGFTPLHSAATMPAPESVALLLEAGADVNAHSSNGLTPLRQAMRWSLDNESITLLLGAGATVNAEDRADLGYFYDTALERGDTELLELLRAAGVVEKEKRREQFQLYNACMHLATSVGLEVGAEDVPGLVEADIEAALESRLRAARLYDAQASSYLLAHVKPMSVEMGERRVGWAYVIDFSFKKQVRDERSGQGGYAETWSQGLIGTAPDDSSAGGAILQSIRAYMDQFIAEYLRVNEEACE